MNIQITNQKMVITSIKMINHDCYELIAKPEGLFIYKPGQFVSFILDKDNQKIRRSYSIANYPKDQLEFIIKPKPEGFMESYLPKLKPGDIINFIGPLGRFQRFGENEPVFIAGGNGISGLTAIIEDYIRNTNKRIELLYSFKTNEDYILKDRLDSWNDRLNTKTFITSSNKRISVDDIKKINNFENKVYYLCGPPEMVNDLKKELESIVKQEDIIVEVW